MAENDSFKVAVYGSHGIKEYNYYFEFIFQNSDFFSHNSGISSS